MSINIVKLSLTRYHVTKCLPPFIIFSLSGIFSIDL